MDVAEQVATLDHICEGRFILGIGLGYRPEEFEAMGTSLAHRGSRLTESLRLMRRLWTEDEVTHHGKHFNVTNARPTARPYQKPYPKVWQAAMSDPAVRRLGREGDILYIGPAQSKATIRHQIDVYHKALEESGKPVPEDMVLVREFFCAPTREEALLKANAGVVKKYEAYAQHGLGGTDEELTRKVTGDHESLMDDTFLVGTPQECIKQIEEYKQMGFTDVMIRLFYPEMPQEEVMEYIDLVGKEVIPALHRL